MRVWPLRVSPGLNRRSVRRAFAALLLAGLAVGATSLLLHPLSPPSGSVRILIMKDRETPLAVTSMTRPGAPQRLPFDIRLQAMDKCPIVGIAVSEGALEERFKVSVGDALLIGGLAATLLVVSPWTGLLQSPAGIPMAHLRIEESKGAANIILPAGQWVTLDESSKGLLIWHEGEAQARHRAQQQSLGLQYARWGVVEGENTSWFSAFTPGTGIDLDDGRQVVLIEVSADGAALRVGVGKSPVWEEKTIRANAADADPLVRFENFAALGTTVIFDAWHADAAVATCYEHGLRTAQVELAAGTQWSTPCLPVTFWLAGLNKSAVPAYPSEDGPLGAVVECSERRFIISEFQPARIGDATVAFLDEEEAVWHYTVDVVKPGTLTPLRAVLATDSAPLRVDGWHIAALPPSDEHPDAAQLQVEPRGWGSWWRDKWQQAPPPR